MAASDAVLISLGSNVDPETHLPRAVALLAERYPVTAASSVWRSAPVGRTDQPAFANAAVRLTVSGVTAAELKAELRAIEDAMGRVRDPADPCGPRTIDLDLSLFGGLVSDAPPLPDPDLFSRWFVAIPLAEVAGEVTVPDDGRTVAAIAQTLRSEIDGERVAWELLATLDA